MIKSIYNKSLRSKLSTLIRVQKSVRCSSMRHNSCFQLIFLIEILVNWIIWIYIYIHMKKPLQSKHWRGKRSELSFQIIFSIGKILYVIPIWSFAHKRDGLAITVFAWIVNWTFSACFNLDFSMTNVLILSFDLIFVHFWLGNP